MPGVVSLACPCGRDDQTAAHLFAECVDSRSRGLRAFGYITKEEMHRGLSHHDTAQAWPAPWYKAAGSRSSGCLMSCSAQTQRLKTIVTSGLAVLSPSQRGVGDGPRKCNGLGPLPAPAPAPLPWPAFSYPTSYTIYPFFFLVFSLLSSFRLWVLPARRAPAAAG